MSQAFVYGGKQPWADVCSLIQKLFGDDCAHWCGDAVEFSGGGGKPDLDREWDEGSVFDTVKELRWRRKNHNNFVVQVISDDEVANTGLERVGGMVFADFDRIQRHNLEEAAHLRVAPDAARQLNRLNIKARRLMKSGKIVAVSLRLEKNDGA